MNLMEEISPEVLRRYVAVGQKIHVEANTIFNITRQIEMSAADKIVVDTVLLGKINQTLSTQLFNIWEALDDFIYLIQTQSVLDDLPKNENYPAGRRACCNQNHVDGKNKHERL